MTANGFLNTGNAPTEESIQSLPDDIEPLTADRTAKNIVFFAMRIHLTPTMTNPLSGVLQLRKLACYVQRG